MMVVSELFNFFLFNCGIGRSQGRTHAVEKGPGKNRSLVVRDSNFRRLEAMREKDSGNQVFFHSFSGAGIELATDEVA